MTVQSVSPPTFSVRRGSSAAASAEIAAQVDAFLRDGGSIDHVRGFSGQVPLREGERKPLPPEDRFRRSPPQTRGTAGSMKSQGYLTHTEAAMYVGLTYDSLFHLVTKTDKGPRIAAQISDKVGRASRFFLREDLDLWIAEQGGAA